MEGKKKAAGWIVLTVVAVVAAVALAATNLATEGPIAKRNLGEAQQTLEGMFPQADDFEEMAAEQSGGLGFAYRVIQGGQTAGYAAKETAQGYGGPVEVILGVNGDMRLVGISVGGSEFKETEGLGSKAKEPAFTDQFKDKAPPLALAEDIDGISGATITSRAVVEAVNSGVNKLNALLGNESAAPGQPAQIQRKASASVIGYGGPVLVDVTVDDQGAIASLTIGRARFQETEGLGAKAKEDSFTGQFVGKTPPVSMDDIDGISGATVTTQAAVDAVNAAASFLNP